jgi:hypothetical protein
VIRVIRCLAGPCVSGATALEDAGRVFVCELPMAPSQLSPTCGGRFLALTLGGSLVADGLRYCFGAPFSSMLVPSLALAPFPVRHPPPRARPLCPSLILSTLAVAIPGL